MLMKLLDSVNFILGIPAAVVRSVYLSLVMLYILSFKGRIAFNMYCYDFMNSPPLTIKEKLKWDFIGAASVALLVIILFI